MRSRPLKAPPSTEIGSGILQILRLGECGVSVLTKEEPLINIAIVAIDNLGSGVYKRPRRSRAWASRWVVPGRQSQGEECQGAPRMEECSENLP